MAFFLHRSDGAQTQLGEVAASLLRIGRGSDAELRFEDAAVDLEHAEIEATAGGYRLRDRGSVTGTYHNGERLVAPVVLAEDDELEIGPYRLKVQHAAAEDPLFLHIARVEQAETADATFHGQLVAERSGAVPAAEAAAAVAAGTPQASAAATPAPTREAAPRLETSEIDYVRSFRLERGPLHKGLIAAILSLAVAATLFLVTVAGQRHGMLSPGPLAEAHARVGDACSSCHPGFRRVASTSCSAAGCHDRLGGHHDDRLARAPACTVCHTEHRGADALSLIGGGDCAGCHGDLPLAAGVEPRFAGGVRGFPESHPEFAIELDDGRRLRLDQPGVRQSDPGALLFNHKWHMTSERIRLGYRQLECVDCHRPDDGEIPPVRFESACRECHELVFDGRFAAPEKNRAPHATPGVILEQVSGRYVLEPTILSRLTSAERSFLRPNWTRRQQLDELARFNVAALLRNGCTKCHRLTPAEPRPGEVEATMVEPTRVRPRWLERARFRHEPHLGLEMACADCHGDVAASSSSDDVLLPTVAVCGECHRPASPAERRADNRLAGADCLQCHGYHGARQASTAVARMGGGEVSP